MYLDYPWIGRVYLCLHSLVLLMKQHSYSFFCGYLAGERRRLRAAETALAATAGCDADALAAAEDVEFHRASLTSASGRVVYPANVTYRNFFDYMMFPTVVYELEYPRRDAINWRYFGTKVAATLGVFFLMIVLAEQFFYARVMHALSLRELPLAVRAVEYPYVLLDLMFPFIVMYLLTWYIIWDAILNAVAEATRFADRSFYGDWWNSVRWDQFAREWNTPVHLFLLRHVYHSSISAFQLSRPAATIMTFLLSSVVHELVMFVIFRKLRGYLLLLQMCQLPLVWVSKRRWLAHRRTLGNVFFWFGIYTGPSLMCSLYLVF
ncbi:membrane bound O-acyl transferase [Dipodascopsis tothii]|uniref:membrane bound O-acyl transferase n=1 Tax=Dipodascopsis tothii TaxID=44089 RepID=UPI0034CD1658